MTVTRWCACAALLFTTPGPHAQAAAQARVAAQACAGLRQIRGEGWQVRSAELVRPPFVPPDAFGDSRSPADTVRVAFCRVTGIARAGGRSEIGFEVWLPTSDRWNGKLQGVGSGGSLGRINRPALARALRRGYAAVATDNGHVSKTGYDVSWALGRPDRVADFGYRAQHIVTVAAKALVRRHFGRPARYAYFVGCSQGGHHGLMEAQRFPEDYDGVLAGAPVYSWTGEMAGQAWNVRALRATPGGALPAAKMAALYAAVVKACGGVSGLVEDPRRCTFDPAALQCTAGDAATCLTSSEVEAVRQLYEGPRTSAGARIYPGLARGSESSWPRLWSDPSRLGGSWLGFHRYMVFGDTAWELRALDFDRDPALAKRMLGHTLDADDPDLSRFARRGGKLLVYHGWGDDMVPAQVSVDYHDSVVARMGRPRVDRFFRLFMAPGMAHCQPGPGPSRLFEPDDSISPATPPERDALVALERWVERGVAPDRLIANDRRSATNTGGDNERTSAAPGRTGLLCPHPRVARYRGSGDVSRAESFVCVSEP